MRENTAVLSNVNDVLFFEKTEQNFNVYSKISKYG